MLNKNQKTVLVSWIVSLQFSNGAIRVGSGPSLYQPEPMFMVIPYFAHLAVLGVLDSDDPRKLEIAGRWIGWYLSHIDPVAGAPLDHWYSGDGIRWTTCPVPSDPFQCNHCDAEDSSLALFFVVIQRYLATGGARKIVPVKYLRPLAKTLLALIDTKDGLSWAKKTYPIKYLMDNSEVHAGLLALALIDSDLEYIAAARKLKATLNSKRAGGMVDSRSIYYLHKDGAGTRGDANVYRWYPDLMAQFWPTIWGVSTSRDQYTTAIRHLRSTVGGNDEPSLAYAMHLRGDVRAKGLARGIYEANAPIFAWPFHVGQAGWLLRKAR